MATKRQILSYDDEEDADIHQFLMSLPERGKSKHIRMAIRLYMQERQKEDTGKLKNENSEPTIQNTPQKPVESNTANQEFIDLDSRLFDLGK